MKHSRGYRKVAERDAKSAALKETLAEDQAKDAAKTARLRALRLAKQAEQEP